MWVEELWLSRYSITYQGMGYIRQWTVSSWSWCVERREKWVKSGYLSSIDKLWWLDNEVRTSPKLKIVFLCKHCSGMVWGYMVKSSIFPFKFPRSLSNWVSVGFAGPTSLIHARWIQDSCGVNASMDQSCFRYQGGVFNVMADRCKLSLYLTS